MKAVYDQGKLLGYQFECPACRFGHIFFTEVPCPKTGKIWIFNNNRKHPTFNNSLYIKGKEICHCVVINGIIEFLKESTHHLKGEKVTLEPTYD
jgi:hypothetical protein